MKMKDLSKYKRIRSKMQNGDVIAFQGRNFGAKAIRVGTKSKYSHVGLVIRIKEVSVERVFILESVTKAGVVLLPISRKLANYKGKAWWCTLNLSVVNGKKLTKRLQKKKKDMILKWAMLELGKQYDFKHIGSIVRKFAKTASF